MPDELRRVRTQAERDADGTALPPIPMREDGQEPYAVMGDFSIFAPRRRWWHRLTRRAL